MVLKKDKTKDLCQKVIESERKFKNLAPTFLGIATTFLFAKENDRMLKLYNEILTLLYTARERAEIELDNKEHDK